MYNAFKDKQKHFLKENNFSAMPMDSDIEYDCSNNSVLQAYTAHAMRSLQSYIATY